MKKIVMISIGLSAVLFSAAPLKAEDAQLCSDQDKAALEQCKATCEAAAPQCKDEAKPLLTLEQVRAAIAEKCNCAASRNYGQYESCVKKLMATLREYSLIDKATRLAIAADNKQCKKDIKDKKKNEQKGPKPKK